MVQLSKGTTENFMTGVPSRMSNIWIASSGWNTSNIRVTTQQKPQISERSSESELQLVGEADQPLLRIESLILTAIVQEKEQEKSLSLYQVEWKPQLSTLSSEQLRKICFEGVKANDDKDTLQFLENIGAGVTLSLCKSLRELTPRDLERCAPHIQRYAQSLRWLLREKENEIDDEERVEILLQRAEAQRPSWKVFTTTARRLKSLMTGQEDPLDVFFRDGLAETFYKSIFDLINDERMRRYLDLATHERPVRILEVGAGTGCMTANILSILSDLEKREGRVRFVDYTYTDISTGFFDNAKTKFQDFENRINFAKLDLEKDPIEAGFEAEAYDTILAGSVLHATTDLCATLRRLRKLLRPGGQLVNFELVPSFPWIDAVFGLLPGWWLSKEEWRNNSPLATEEQWNKVLLEAQFSGTDIIFQDLEGTCHVNSIMISTAVESTSEMSIIPLETRILIDGSSEQQTTVARELLDGTSGTIIGLDDIKEDAPLMGELVISLLNLGTPTFANLTSETFQSMKLLVKSVKRLIWVVSGDSDESSMPQLEVSLGFFRSIKSEMPEKHLVTLILESDAEGKPPTDPIGYIRQVIHRSITSGAEEMEYIVKHGCLTIGRVVEVPILSDGVRAMLVPQPRLEQWLPGRPVRLEIEVPGVLDTLKFVDDSDSTNRNLADCEIEIEARAWPISFRDVVIALGQLENSSGMGLEVAGQVTRVGSKCQGLGPGDRILLASAGSMRTHPRGHISTTCKFPDEWSYEDAVSIVNPGMTAYHALVNLAKLRKGERILIHSAAGSTGQMALHIAKMVGAEVFATVGYQSKKDYLKERFEIAEDHIFYSRTTSFAQGIKRMTGGKGVDVILNSLSGHALTSTWECIAPHGRFVEIGKLDISSNSTLPMAQFRGNVSFFALDIEHIFRSDVELAHELLEKVVDLTSRGLMDFPHPRYSQPVSEIKKAFRLVQNGKHTGRVIITTETSEKVLKSMRNISAWKFDPKASYMVVGGLGGLGRSIMQWMALKGARHLIALSRSGTNTGAAKDMITKLEAQGITVKTIKCDASSASDMSDAFEECQRTMPPIKGCINGANVLQDAIFGNMTYKQWALTFKTKVAGSWNLHLHLPTDIDFFILLSSLCGIQGGPGQANYAAGCTYQDSLARYRVSRGLKATSIDIGWMQRIGIVAETERYTRTLESMGGTISPVDEEDLLALLDRYCDPSCSVLSPADSQVVLGVRTAAECISHGAKPSAAMLRPIFAGFIQLKGGLSQAPQSMVVEDTALVFQHSKDPEEQKNIVVRSMQRKLASLLAVPPENIDSDRPVYDYGVDSLVGTELRNWISFDFKAQVAVFELMGGTSITGLAQLIVERTEMGAFGQTAHLPSTEGKIQALKT